MRPVFALILIFVACRVAVAQMPYQLAPTPSTGTGWGGYAVPPEVPYQPTFPNDCVQPTPPGTTPAWQMFPASTEPAVDAPGQAVMLDNLGPGVAPIAVPADGGYQGTGEPDLKKSLIPPGARDGFFQKLRFRATWIPQPDINSVGWTDLRSEVVTALPFFTRENPIIITPSYELHFLDGPDNLDLPPRLNDAAIDFHVFRVWDNHWIADFAVTPGVYADDHSLDSSDAIRINGRAVGAYAPTIDLKYVFGVTYLDGGWAKIVPVVGVIYMPSDDTEYQLIFPTPKISWRLNNLSPVPGRDERWVYVAMDYGNAAWTIQQSAGTETVLASRDYRVLFGFERRLIGGISHTIEAGYVFNRDLKVASISGDDIDQDSAFLLRVGVWY